MGMDKSSKASSKNAYLVSMVIISVLFFIFGFVTWVNGPLINILQRVCGTTPFKASLVTLAFYISYFFMALPSSFILRKTGYKNGMAIGLFIMAAGAVLFIPAAYSRMFGIFMAGLFVLGAGMSLIQTAVNPFVTIIGPIESAAARISVMGICNKFAGVISPLLLTALVMNGLNVRLSKENFDVLSTIQQQELLNEFAGRMVLPYLALAAFLVIFAGLIKVSSLPDHIEIEDDGHDTLKDFIKQIPAAFRIKHLVFGVITIFLYVGVEVIAADSLTQFGKHLELSYAPKLTSFTMVFMVIGYIIGIALIPKYVSQAKALLVSAALGIVFTVFAIFSSTSETGLFDLLGGWLNSLFHLNIPALPNSVLLVALLGLANAIMWPAIWPLTLENMGKFTKIASALLIMGIAGGAILPPTYARLGQSIGFQEALWIAVPCYVVILFFAAKSIKTTAKNLPA
jgi:MFS transporter, FHS family, L-fucose permease